MDPSSKDMKGERQYKNHPHNPLTMPLQRELQEAISNLGLAEIRRHKREDETLDRETTDYIRRKLDRDDPRLESFQNVLQVARNKVKSTTQYLDQSSSRMNFTVRKLTSFLQAPSGWFMDLCLKHELTVPLKPTFPPDYPCEEIQEAARQSLYLQFCVNEFYVPAQLIVREILVNELKNGDSSYAEDTLMLIKSQNESDDLSNRYIQTPSQALTAVSSSRDALQNVDQSSSISNTNNVCFHPKVFQAKSTSRMFSSNSCITRNQNNFLNTNITATCNDIVNHLPTAIQVDCWENSKQKHSHSCIKSELFSDHSSQNRISKECDCACYQIQSDTKQKLASELQDEQTKATRSLSSLGISIAAMSDTDAVDSSNISICLDPMHFTPECKHNGHKTATSTSLPTMSSTLTDRDMDLDDHDVFRPVYLLSQSTEPFNVSQNSSNSDNPSASGRDSNRLKQTAFNTRDTRIVRESKEASVPQCSDNKVSVCGHYILKGNKDDILTFKAFVHKKHTVHQGHSRLVLYGSYIRRMETTMKNLRWKLHYVIEA